MLPSSFMLPGNSRRHVISWPSDWSLNSSASKSSCRTSSSPLSITCSFNLTFRLRHVHTHSAQQTHTHTHSVSLNKQQANRKRGLVCVFTALSLSSLFLLSLRKQISPLAQSIQPILISLIEAHSLNGAAPKPAGLPFSTTSPLHCTTIPPSIRGS